ncbi:MAG: hypothetical protein KKF98_01975 [Bacteroidetes bacterium]|nr:hypothetical protein [Bacteroidota bacterium]
MKTLKLFTLIYVILCTFQDVRAQVYTNIIVGEKNEEIKDSIINQAYPYALPIWGAAATAKGYELPYSAGLGINYFWQESDLLIENLSVGFNNGPMYDLNEIIRFNSAVSTANSINIRPDFWLFPFLNIYGIFAKAKTSTAIDAGLWIPDASGSWSEISSFSTKAEFEATGMGLGLTPTIGVGGGWLALDMNMLWTDVSALDKPVFTIVFGPRAGKTFQLKNPESNIAFWVGAFRLNFSSETNGSINLSEILPTDNLQTRVDAGLVKVGETSAEVEGWWESLTALEQKNPGNIAKYETANRALETAGNVLNSIDGALNDENYASVQYSLEKRLKDKWNFVVGTQYQINRHFMVRAEYGFLGSRKQFIGGLQYRFGI